MNGKFFFILLNILIGTFLSLYIFIGYIKLLMLKLLDILLFVTILFENYICYYMCELDHFSSNSSLLKSPLSRSSGSAPS